MPIPIFISVGQRYKPEQETLMAQVFAALAAKDLAPTTLPHSAWDETFPLVPIQSSMRQCFGVVIVAFPRITADVAREWPDSDRETQLQGRSLATVWLQIEATLALELGKPLLILVDDRLHPEGVLNPKHKGYGAHYFNMNECQRELPANILQQIAEFSEQAKALSGSGQRR